MTDVVSPTAINPDDTTRDGGIPDPVIDTNARAVKFDQLKSRMDLIPSGPLLELGRVYLYGVQKYAARNWEKGFDWGRVYAAAQRHMLAFWGGEEIDPESGLSHLMCAAWGMFALEEFRRTHREFDDRSGSKNTLDKSS